MAKKQRLDALLAVIHPDLSRTILQSLIMQGKARVNGQVVTKPGVAIAHDAEVALDRDMPKFVSRAGLKLEAALDARELDVTDLIIMDAGLSTGGFTDCLLQRGARRVYGVDVGHGQVHEKILSDDRVVVMERTNLRYLESLPDAIDLATLDLSFISLLTVMPAVLNVLKPDGRVLCLIKPQFEAGREHVRRGGLVIDEKVHQSVIDRVVSGCAALGLHLIDEVIPSPIQGAVSGNIEFLALFKRKLGNAER
jgi:23S rRNA (cytidine1920-2'-O)/16S rRNA (cytidine1409-2'-O)-methyltransferase